MAMALLGAFAFSFGRLLDVVAIPHLVALSKDGDQAGFDRVSGGLFVLSALGGAALGLGLLLAREPVSALAWGFDPGRRAMLVAALAWMAPAAAFYLPMRFLGALFRATRRFSLFLQAEAVVTLATLVLLAAYARDPAVLMWSFTAGLGVGFGYLLLRGARTFNLLAAPWSPEVATALAAAPALWLTHLASYLYVLSDRLFMTFLPEKGVGALIYGAVVVRLLPAFVSPGNAFLTIFAEKRHAGESGEAAVNDLISFGVLLGLPAAGFLALHAERLIAAMLERGAFTAADTSLTAAATRGFALGLVPLLLSPALTQVFQVLGRNDVLVRRALAGFGINMALSAWFLFGLGWGLQGLALATGASQLAMLALVLRALGPHGVPVAWGRHARWTGLVALGTGGGLVASAAWSALPPAPWVVAAQALTFGLVLAGLALAAPGVEGELVRRHAPRLLPARLRRFLP